MGKYSTKQILTLLTFAIADFCSAVCVSLQAPFYPQEAENKGATATEYGFVFGIFELTVFLVSPLYGKYLNKIGPKFMFNAGIFTTGTTCILFGFLDKIASKELFIGFSFAIRIVEALGNAGFLTASFSIIAKEFPDNVGATFAALETCFGLGMIVGPTLGGGLYELGGYTLPFVSLGLVLLCAALMTAFVLPSHKENTETSSQGSGQLIGALKIPAITIAVFAIIAASISIGFLQATLEPHLRPLNLSPFQTGLMFILNGAAYAATAPLWGWLSDKVIEPRYVVLFGAVMIIDAFLLVGPAPYIPLERTIPICIIALLLHGVGSGAELVATFSGSHREAINYGFPDDLETYGLISGIWTSTFALGAFMGPTIGGALYDAIGFSWATQVVVVLHALVLGSTLMYQCCHRNKTNIYKTHASLAESGGETKHLLGKKSSSSDDSCYNSGIESSQGSESSRSSLESIFL